MKQIFNPADSHFDLKFLLVGNPGSGKTDFCATYTQGPVHFYMLDPGGEKTLKKTMRRVPRPENCPITISSYRNIQRVNRYDAFWKEVQKDGKEGFFEEMAEKSGLVVLPDSLSEANELALQRIAHRNKRDLLNPTNATGKHVNGMRINDWGQLSTWMKLLVSTVNDLPCAAAMTAHLYTETDEDGAVIARFPAIAGQFRASMGRLFDEVYLMKQVGNNYQINFKSADKFDCGSRVFSSRFANNITLDNLASAYTAGKEEVESR